VEGVGGGAAVGDGIGQQIQHLAGAELGQRLRRRSVARQS
jgi:hypothetical protein